MKSAYFHSFGKLAASVLSLKIWHSYWENISLFSLARISSCDAAFLVFNFLISFAITSLSTDTKENSVVLLEYCFTLKMLGCLLYFLLHAITYQFHLPYHKDVLMCSQCYQKMSWKFQLFLYHLSKPCHLQQVLFCCSWAHFFQWKVEILFSRITYYQ